MKLKLKQLIETTVREHLNNYMLNEASFYELDHSKIFNDKYIKDYIDNDDMTEYVLDAYIEQENLDEDDKDDIKKSPEFYEFIEDKLRNEFQDAIDNLDNKIHYKSGKLRLYRAITVDNNWLHHLKTQGKRLGIYWSWDSNSADTHWGDASKPNVAVIEAEIHEKYVNWKTTLEMNMNPSMSDEREVRLFKNTPIDIISITIDDKPVDISTLKNKVFYA